MEILPEVFQKKIEFPGILPPEVYTFPKHWVKVEPRWELLELYNSCELYRLYVFDSFYPFFL
jgi:hypothetical protein